MEYAFLIYTTETLHENMTPEQMQDSVNRNLAIVKEATERDVFRGLIRLAPPKQGVTARRHEKGSRFTDGPFAETKEILGGFYLIECEDEEDARAWARRLNQTGCSTAVEFRPVGDAITRDNAAAVLGACAEGQTAEDPAMFV